MLDGGHGWLQGRYGKMSDNFFSASVVLANDTAISVSEHEHKDLVRGLRGAGHNFGIVTSFEYRIRERRPETDGLTIETTIFTQEKLEDVFAAANGLLGRVMPVELAHTAQWLFMPEIDVDKPMVIFHLIYQAETVPLKCSQRLLALAPVTHTRRSTNLLGIAAIVGFSDKDTACQHGTNLLRFPASFHSCDIPGLRQTSDVFSAIPSPFRQYSLMILERWPTEAVQTIADERTAYPDRGSNVLLSPFIVYAPSESLDTKAAAFGISIRETLANASGKPLIAYLNYAYGDKSREAMYGHEPWRIEKLRQLEAEYNPQGRFNHYKPIVG